MIIRSSIFWGLKPAREGWKLGAGRKAEVGDLGGVCGGSDVKGGLGGLLGLQSFGFEASQGGR